jgi:hypothetical protein
MDRWTGRKTDADVQTGGLTERKRNIMDEWTDTQMDGCAD